MPARRIRIQVLGSREDKGHVRLSDFIRHLDLMRNALKQTERQITGEEGSVYWRIIDLSHNSPATVVLEEVLRKPAKGAPRTGRSAPPPVVERFIDTMREIRQ